MSDYYEEVLNRQQKKQAELDKMGGVHSLVKKRKLEDGSEIIEMALKYNRYYCVYNLLCLAFLWQYDNIVSNHICVTFVMYLFQKELPR